MSKKKITLFLINTLSNGGAERVVANLANEIIKENREVIIITLYNDHGYKIDSNIKIVNLYNKKIGKLKKILLLPFIIKKLDKEISKIRKIYDIELYTSHLIFPHLISRLSKFRDKCIYVVHNPYYPYEKRMRLIFKIILQFIYNKRKIVTVSKGVKEELLQRYNIKTKYITTIYNPIDVKGIGQMPKEEVQEKNFILFCGRFNNQKRPDLAVDIFYKTKLYEKYNLLMIGQGELENIVKEKIDYYKLKDKVILKGWQQNPYKYMKNALVLMNCSYSEAFPMTLIEAFACECKVVSFDINYGPNELLKDKFKKYLVENNNLELMGKTIELAIKDYPKDLNLLVQQYQTYNIVEQYYIKAKEWKV